MLSLELINEVLEFKVVDFELTHIYGGVHLKYKEKSSTIINIYELAHICKEWVISNGYDILSGGLQDGMYSCYIDKQNNYTEDDISFYAKTEVEAIFKACNYIMKEKD